MSRFINILFSEEFMFEGEQADAYRARKAKEKEDEERKYKDQALRRYPSPANNWKDNYGHKNTRKNPKMNEIRDKAFDGDEKAMDEWDDRYTSDKRRQSNAAHMANKDYYSGKRKMNSDQNVRAIDATDRHMRRHPKQYKESVELYNGAIELI